MKEYSKTKAFLKVLNNKRKLTQQTLVEETSTDSFEAFAKEELRNS